MPYVKGFLNIVSGDEVDNSLPGQGGSIDNTLPPGVPPIGSTLPEPPPGIWPPPVMGHPIQPLPPGNNTPPGTIWPPVAGIDNTLPGRPVRPDQSLPPSSGQPDNTLPGGSGGMPDQGLPSNKFWVVAGIPGYGWRYICVDPSLVVGTPLPPTATPK